MLKRLLDTGASAVKHRQLLPPVRFMLVTTGRSGSKLLVDLLDSHPQITCDFELLHDRVQSPLLHLSRRAALAGASGSKAWGFSLHPPHLLRQGVADHAGWVARVNDQGVRLITLIRGNPVAYAISALVARESETWHTYGDEEEKREPVTIDLDRLLRYMTNIENDIRKTRTLVGARGHMALTYERDLAEADARQATLDRLFTYLDLDPHPLTAATTRRRTPYPELVANWNDVERLVTGTRWEPYLEGL
jgi:hypothetical protein